MSRGTVPQWLKEAAGIKSSADLVAKWPKGTELRQGAALPPTANTRRPLTRKTTPVRKTAKTAKTAPSPAEEGTK